jgi:hypothetical protein
VVVSEAHLGLEKEVVAVHLFQVEPVLIVVDGAWDGGCLCVGVLELRF